jgi:hypothetical protein
MALTIEACNRAYLFDTGFPRPLAGLLSYESWIDAIVRTNNEMQIVNDAACR